MPELLLRDAALLRRRHVNFREFVAPMPGPAGIDDRAAVGVVAGRLALGLDTRVEGGRPGVAYDVDRSRGVGAGEHRPRQLFQVGYVDVVVDHDDVAPAISADVAHGRHVAHLLAMAGIALTDGHREQEPRVADLMRPRGGDAGHAGLTESRRRRGL